MGKWIYQISETIDSHLNLIKKRIVESFNPSSIIISGSFGKDEGSLYFVSGDRVKYLSDYEIIIVRNRPIPGAKLKKLSRELSEEIGAEVGLYHNFLFKYTSSFLRKFFYKDRLLPLNVYDRRYSCKIIYGRDVIEQLPALDAKNIPVWEGIRLVLNRVAQALKNISYQDLFTNDERNLKEKLYWIYRIIMACSDALLICDKSFHYSYEERCLIFKRIFAEKFPVLRGKFPAFTELVEEATNYKLNPAREEKDIRKLWFEIRNICDEVFRFLIKKELGITFETYGELQGQYLRHPKVRRQFYRYISCGFQNLMNMNILIKMNGMRMFRHKSLFVNLHHQMFYSLIMIFYFSVLNSDGSLRTEKMNFIRAGINKSFACNLSKSESEKKDYDMVRCALGELWGKLHI